MIRRALLGLEVSRRDERISVPGVITEVTYEPSTQAEVADVVNAAAAEKAGLLILGGHTRLRCANPAPAIQVGLSLGGLTGIDEFEPDEGVLHAAAGTKIAEIRAVVRQEGWELPLDSPGAGTTVGGTIASAVTGPRALAFGSVSDAVLGLDVVGGDGVASKCGGRVVKNVTGYDLAKLYCGSYGSLAVVTGAWLRLRPAAAVVEAYRARLPSTPHQTTRLQSIERGTALGATTKNMANPGIPSSKPIGESFEMVRTLSRLTCVRAFVWCESPGDQTSEVFVELGGSEEGVNHDRSRLAEMLSLEAVPLAEIDALRDARTEEAALADAVVVRARVLGSRCEAMRREILTAGLHVSIDPGLGVIHARGRVDDARSLRAIRASAERAGGFATIEKMPDPWRSKVDVFGSLGGSEALALRLKRKFDPAGVLNPGRFVAEEPHREH